MASIRLVIDKAELVDGVITITSLNIIDGVSGNILKPAKITPELLELFKTVEIELSDYMKIAELKKNNPAFMKLVNTFNLAI